MAVYQCYWYGLEHPVIFRVRDHRADVRVACQLHCQASDAPHGRDYVRPLEGSQFV
jgi:hypothetical protein